MLTLRLPVEDRRQGLAERPDAFVACVDAGLSSATLLDHDIAAGRTELDPKAMAAEYEIACRYGAVVERVAARHGLLPSIIAGFCSRRSGWGLSLSPAGVDGTRNAREYTLSGEGRSIERGLMGLDFDRHPFAPDLNWRDPEGNIDAAFALIAGYRTNLRRRTTLQGTGLQRAALSAFECGPEPVERALRLGLDVDGPACGCGRDVLLRAGYFQREGWD